MSEYTISLLMLLLSSFSVFAQDEESDSTANVKVEILENQLLFGVDFFHPVMNSFSNAKKSYEFTADYTLPKDVYAVLEGGFGNATVNYINPQLSYTSSNSFVRLGINKSMLQRMHTNDWDIVFIGLRYGLAFINRSDAFYTMENEYFGNVSNVVPRTNLTAHWLEITGGMRVELWKGIFAGYNIRAKFLINPKTFKELAPYYITGFGKGEKTAVFDFNMYLSYAIRWRKKSAPMPVAPTTPQR